MKTVLVILDGLGDRPQKELGGKTPLEAAYTPNLDKLCLHAETGMMIPYIQGLPLGTEVAHFILFGYDVEDFPGRGIVNAMSRGFELEDDAVYMVSSWASVEEKGGLAIKERWAKDLSIDDVAELKKSLPSSVGDISFEWDSSLIPHGVLKLEGDSVSSQISDSDPFYDNSYVMEVEPYENDTEAARNTAEALNEYLRLAYHSLKNNPVNKRRKEQGMLPANFLLTKWAGRKPKLMSFEDMHGMKACMVGSGKLMLGISKLIGSDYFDYKKDFEAGVQMAVSTDYEFVHLHTKETDEAAHTKNPWNKVRALEEIDGKLDRLVEAALNEEILLVVTGDHTTPSSGSMIHSGEPVPIMFVGKNVRVDDVVTFGERSCSRGSLRMQGSDLMQMVLNFTDKAQFYNFRAGSRKINHIPKHIKKFKF